MNTPNHIIIDGDAIAIQPSESHDYLLTTKEVARGYGVSASTIKEHKRVHADELLADAHFLEVRNPDFQPGTGGAHTTIMWTRLGAYTLGFFIRSERAKLFRAELAKLAVRIATGESVEVKRSEVDHIAAGFAALSKTVELLAEMQRRLVVGQSHLQARLELVEQRLARVEGASIAAIHAPRPQPAPLTEEEALAEALRLCMGFESLAQVRAAAVAAIIKRYGLPVPLSEKQPANSLGKRLAHGVELRTRDGQTVRVAPQGRNRHRRYIVRRS